MPVNEPLLNRKEWKYLKECINYQIVRQDKSNGVIESFNESHRRRYLCQAEIELQWANAGLTPWDRASG